MAWSLLRGHTCDPADVVKGYCGSCGTTWTRNDDEWDLTKKGLRGVDIRDINGRPLPLI